MDTKIDKDAIKNAAIEELAEVLGFDAHERQMAHLGSSLAWAAFSVTTLSGGEYGKSLPRSCDPMWVSSSEALSFFGGESSKSGKNYLDFNAGHLALKMEALYNGDAQQKQRFVRASQVLGRLLFTVGFSEAPREQKIAYILQILVRKVRDGHGPDIVVRGACPALTPVVGTLHDIVTYGPGLGGAELYGGLLSNGGNIHYVSGGKGAHFVNEFIRLGCAKSVRRKEEFAARSEPPDSRLAVSSPSNVAPIKAHFYTDGIAASAGQLGTNKKDTFIMSSVHTAGVDECIAGIEFSAEHLVPGGRLVIKAPDISLGDEAGLDRIMPCAIEALGQPAVTGACGNLSQGIDPKLPLWRSASYAIFYKQ